MEENLQGDDHKPSKFTRFKHALSKVGRKILPAVAGIAAGIAIGPLGIPIAQFITSKLVNCGISVDQSNVEGIVSELLKGSTSETIETTLEQILIKNGKFNGNKINALIKKGNQEIRSQIKISITNALRPTYVAIQEVVQYIRKYPEEVNNQLKELIKSSEYELKDELKNQIEKIEYEYERKLDSGFDSISDKLWQIDNNIVNTFNKFNGQLTELIKIFTDKPVTNKTIINKELALSLCSAQIDSEIISSRFDIEYDPELYVHRNDAESEIFRFINEVSAPGGSLSNIFILLSGMGIGKTWLLGYIAHEILKKEIPVLFFEMNRGSVERIVSILGTKSSMDAYEKIARFSQATDKPIIIILDGLDELPSGRRKVLLNWILDARARIELITNQMNIGFIISSRDYDWQNDIRIQEIIRLNKVCFYKKNPNMGSLILKKFNENQLILAAKNYGILNDINGNERIKEMARYPFITKLFGDYKLRNNIDTLPDPNDLNEFLPLFYDQYNINSDTILARMGVIGVEIYNFLGTLLKGCRESNLELDMNFVQTRNLNNSPHFNLLISSGLFIRTPGWTEEIKINPIYSDLIREIKKRYIEPESDIAFDIEEDFNFSDETKFTEPVDEVIFEKRGKHVDSVANKIAKLIKKKFRFTLSDLSMELNLDEARILDELQFVKVVPSIKNGYYYDEIELNKRYRIIKNNLDKFGKGSFTQIIRKIEIFPEDLMNFLTSNEFLMDENKTFIFNKSYIKEIFKNLLSENPKINLNEAIKTKNLNITLKDLNPIISELGYLNETGERLFSEKYLMRKTEKILEEYGRLSINELNNVGNLNLNHENLLNIVKELEKIYIDEKQQWIFSLSYIKKQIQKTLDSFNKLLINEINQNLKLNLNLTDLKKIIKSIAYVDIDEQWAFSEKYIITEIHSIFGNEIRLKLEDINRLLNINDSSLKSLLLEYEFPIDPENFVYNREALNKLILELGTILDSIDPRDWRKAIDLIDSLPDFILKTNSFKGKRDLILEYKDDFQNKIGNYVIKTIENLLKTNLRLPVVDLPKSLVIKLSLSEIKDIIKESVVIENELYVYLSEDRSKEYNSIQKIIDNSLKKCKKLQKSLDYRDWNEGLNIINELPEIISEDPTFKMDLIKINETRKNFVNQLSEESDKIIIEELEKELEISIKKLNKVNGRNISVQFNEKDRVIGLSLPNCNLADIPEKIMDLTSLHYLFLNSNKIKSLPNSIKNLKSLLELSLNKNNLETLPESTCELNSLKSIDLSQNNLINLPNSIGILKSLKILNLESNSIKRLPDSFDSLESLEELYLGWNKLQFIPIQILYLKNLKILELKNNELVTLPPTINDLINLEILDLSRNMILNIPDTFGKLIKLQKLDLNSNKINFLPFEFRELHSLEILNLKDNNIVNFPPSITFLKRLRILDISNNQLFEIPDSITNLKSLNTLLLYGNKIKYLPENFGDLLSLENLYLEGNNLKNLSASISNLKNLKKLDLEDNQIQNIDLLGLENLQELNLKENKIKNVSEDLSNRLLNLPNLKFINLENNPIEKIDKKILKKLKKNNINLIIS